MDRMRKAAKSIFSHRAKGKGFRKIPRISQTVRIMNDIINLKGLAGLDE